MSKKLIINGSSFDIYLPDDVPLLWVLRDEVGLTGTKFGCGVSSCGACTVHIDGAAVKSCQVPLGEVWGEVVTIEGLGEKDSLHPVQQSWIENQVAQCGYCQPGQIMKAAALLAENPELSDKQIDEAMHGNLCRCGTYDQIREAIKQQSTKMRGV